MWGKEKLILFYFQVISLECNTLYLYVFLQVERNSHPRCAKELLYIWQMHCT